MEWILDSGNTKGAKRAESLILGRDFRNQLSGYEKKLDLQLVIHVSVHIDILKAENVVLNSGFSSHKYPES